MDEGRRRTPIPPRLTFFCELDSEPLQALFSDESVLEKLKNLEASVSLGILDLTSERATIVRGLNKAGIPVIAWLLLPMEDGYWFNLDNVAMAVARYEAFKMWTKEERLQWSRIGLDIEPDIREFVEFKQDKIRLLIKLTRRIFDRMRLPRAYASYSALVNQIHADGYPVDSYHLPPIVDERQVGSTLLQRVGGLVSIPVDREVLMLYSSFVRPWGPGILWSYGKEAQSVGVGSTGGGVQIAGMGEVPPLDWDAFSRDLRLAYRLCEDIHVFSLEGCVAQGFLARLESFDWETSILPPLKQAKTIQRFRQGLRLILWVSARPMVMLAGLLIVFWVVLRRRLKRR